MACGRRWVSLFRGLLSRLLLCLFAVLTLVVMLEVALRIKHRGVTVDRWAIPDKRYGFLHRKNFRQTVRPTHADVTWEVQINSMGFRGPERDLSETNALRILLLGDSFTFGYGVDYEETFGAQVEALFRESGREVQVFNAGVTGWGTLQALLFARDYLNVLKPDVIILTFCENDQIDDEVFARGGSGGLLPSFPGKRWLRDHSRLYSFLYERLYGLMYYRLFVSSGPDSQRVEHASKELAVEVSSREHQVLGSDVWWDRTGRSMHAFQEIYTNARPHGLMLIQTSEFWNREQSARLQTIADRERLVFVDLWKDAPQVGREEARLDFDPHWNPDVHRMSAERLFREIGRAVGAE